MTRLTPKIRAVFFDAVGTLLHPEPPATTVYAAIGARHGSRLAPEVVVARFRTAFRRQEEQDYAAGHRTSEARELARWRTIVGEVLDDVTDVEGCFRALYDHFARPGAWRLDADAGETLRALAARGFALGVCSNFDHRLRGLIEAFPDLRWLRHLVISSEVGWKKPAPGFFVALARTVELSPEQILIVGDDVVNDFDGARAARFSAVLLDPRGQSGIAPEYRIGRLSTVLSWRWLWSAP